MNEFTLEQRYKIIEMYLEIGSLSAKRIDVFCVNFIRDGKKRSSPVVIQTVPLQPWNVLKTSFAGTIINIRDT